MCYAKPDYKLDSKYLNIFFFCECLHFFCRCNNKTADLLKFKNKS